FLKRPTDQPLRAASASNIPSKPERPQSLSELQYGVGSGFFKRKRRGDFSGSAQIIFMWVMDSE
ncbi:MAG: hypothetical protein ACSHX7_08995, partial [Luteolibacter sp.]